MKGLARLFPGKMRMWRAHVWKAFVNLVRNARRLASPRQTYDDSDVVLMFAGLMHRLQGVHIDGVLSLQVSYRSNLRGPNHAGGRGQ